MPYRKHLDVTINNKLDFKEHINNTILKVDKSISVIRNLRHGFPLKLLVTIYNAFLRPLTHYEDNIYDQQQNYYFCEKLESVQYKTVLVIIGAIQGVLEKRSTKN